MARKKPLTEIAMFLTCLSLSVQAQFELTWYSLDGGGVVASVGGIWTLDGTIGQCDSGVLAGGEWELAGGFWPAAATSAPIPGDLDGDCDVDIADLTGCLSNFGCNELPDCLCDINGDGIADITDLSILLSNFGTSCP